MAIQRALSIRQPYVEQILLGKKRIEYRSRPTNIRERVYLYASLTPGGSQADWRHLKKEPGDLPTGVIVGTVEIADCRYDERDACYHYLLKNPQRLAKPLVPHNQPQPGFWHPQF